MDFFGAREEEMYEKNLRPYFVPGGVRVCVSSFVCFNIYQGHTPFLNSLVYFTLRAQFPSQ